MRGHAGLHIAAWVVDDGLRTIGGEPLRETTPDPGAAFHDYFVLDRLTYRYCPRHRSRLNYSSEVSIATQE